MIKLIASDMDGTLLNDKNEIHEEFYKVFQELKKQNIIFAAASGRQYYNLAKRFEKIKDDMMFIAENGTFVVYKGEELLLNALDKETAIELIKIGRDIKESYVVLCGKKSAYIESKDERLIKEVVLVSSGAVGVGVNKGIAINKLQELLNIKHEETMVFGDYLNDLEMMESAYHSYAMENAHDDLKKVARFRAKKNTENGVVEKIKEVLNI